MRTMKPTELLSKMDRSVHQNIANAIAQTGATHVVLLENVDFNSSRFGDRTCCMVGPGCTYKTPEDWDGHHLHDLPSMRQYPQGACPADEVLKTIDCSPNISEKNPKTT